MKKSKVKGAARAFLILTIVFLVIFVGAYLAYYLTDTSPAGGFAGVLATILVLPQAFVYVFNAAAAPDFVALCGTMNPLIMSIALYAVAGIDLILIVLGIVVVCLRKKGLYCLYLLPFLFVMFAEAILLTSGIKYVTNVITAFKNGDLADLVGLILMIATVVGGALAAIFGYVTYGLGLAASKVKPEVEDGTLIDEDSTPVLSDGEVPPEVEEDVVPELVPEYIPVAEPEPDVEPEVVEDASPEVVEEPAPEEPEVVEEPEVKDEPAPAPVIVEGDEKGDESHHVEVNVTNAGPAPAPTIDQNALASLLREVVRDIVRDEIARNNANQPKPAEDSGRRGGDQHIVGATFGGHGQVIGRGINLHRSLAFSARNSS